MTHTTEQRLKALNALSAAEDRRELAFAITVGILSIALIAFTIATLSTL